ncbi:MAG TPA: DHHA1 domain-containing protein [Clostridia bacterium]|nr:DHHA1 domain-containing protein [Clostridia bacterium]
MTEKLYYDHDIRECEASVLACRAGENCFEVLLDRTVIFPEGGGQPSDTGSVGGAAVSYAFEDGHDVWHRCARAFPVGAKVTVRFDEQVRRDHSQQHTGEHMLSGVAHRLYGCANVGFHMAEDYVSVDFDRPFTQAEIRALELALNEAVQRDEPTTYAIVDAAELDGMELRKRAKGLTGEARIVYAGGVDSCTCCGTHCGRAGEVGFVKITSFMSYKGGARVFFLCGMRAVKAAMEEARLLDAIARRFSTKAAEAAQAVVKQGEELTDARRVLKKRTEELFDYKAAEILRDAPKAGDVSVAVTLGEGLNMAELGMLCESVCKKGKAVVVAMSENGGQLLYRMARAEGVKLGMREVCQAVNAMTGGKGGGRDDSAQGSAGARSETAEIRAQLEAYLKSRLKPA